MNRILFGAEEIRIDGTVLLSDARAEHIRRVLHAVSGQLISTGTLNGQAGVSRVLNVTESGVLLSLEHTVAIPEPWFDLVLAVPRPKVLKRLFPQLAALGVGRLVLLNAYKVEKCYFSSQWLDPLGYRPLLIEGLTQAGLTRVPEVQIRPRFKHFVEDELDSQFPSSLRLLAHPGPRSVLSKETSAEARPLLAVGPEGGWTPYEKNMLLEHGFELFSLGERILRSDTACIALVSVLEYELHASRNQ